MSKMEALFKDKFQTVAELGKRMTRCECIQFVQCLVCAVQGILVNPLQFVFKEYGGLTSLAD